MKADLSDLMFQQMFMNELDDMKTQLDGLSRKDLLSSISFLKEGVSLLKISLDATFKEETATMPKGKKDKDQLKYMKVQESFITGQALPLAFAQAIGDLKITSEERFSSATDCFKKSRENATEAFSNEALSIDERILATKMRITSRILESLQDPDAAATACRTYLEELHALPGVRAIFGVMLEGGMKARFKKTKRLENVKAVTQINLVLFEFTRRFTNVPVDLFTWSRIELKDRTYHPLLGETRSWMQQLGETTPSCFQITLTEGTEINPYISAVNSKGDIITETTQGIATVKDNEILSFGSFPKSDTKSKDFSVVSLAVNDEDDVYTITRSKKSNGPSKYKFWVFSPEGKIKQETKLKFLYGEDGPVSIAAGEDKTLIIQRSHENDVQVCDYKGKLQTSFPLSTPESSQYVFLQFSKKDGIISARDGGGEVCVQDTKGNLQRSIKLPDDYQAKGVAFDYKNRKIVVLALDKELSLHLLSYSSSDEPQKLEIGLLENDAINTTNINSHSKGPMVVIYEQQVTYI